MNNLELNGEWTTQIELKQLAQLNNLKFFSYENSKQHLSLLEKGLITIDFWDEHNVDPDPSKEQNSTLNFIVENQNAILQSLFEGLKNIIYPKYQEQVDVDEYSFPPLNSLADLELVFGMRSITITTYYKEKLAYYEMNFAFSGDSEHGLLVNMHKLRIISFCGMGDNDGRAVYEDMGHNYEKWLQEYLDLTPKIKKIDFKVHQKNSKYNKLKPWQKDENQDYLRELIRNDELDKLKSLIENKEIDIEEKNSIDKTILCTAVSMKKISAVQLLLNKGAKVGNAILECSEGEKTLKNEILQLLVQSGGNIDYLGYWKRTILYYEIGNWVNTFQNISIEEGKQSNDRLEKYKNEFENHTRNIIFLIKLGANPMNCDGENSTYLTLLRKRWSEDYLSKIGVANFIDSLSQQ